MSGARFGALWETPLGLSLGSLSVELPLPRLRLAGRSPACAAQRGT
jgi:hypothetical protein